VGNFNDLGNRIMYGVPLAVVALTCLAFESSAGVFIAVIAAIFVCEVAVILWRNWPSLPKHAAVPIAFLVMGVTGFGFAFGLRHQDNGFYTLFLVALGVVATDAFAYIGGRKFGHSKFFPGISPNKTREGVLIGAGCGMTALLVGWSVLRRLELTDLKPLSAMMVVIILPIVAVAGDLLESKAKRLLGVKDFGKCLGSHGGVADRFDAMTAAFVAYGVISLYSM